VELYLHSPNTPSWHGAQLGGVQGQLYLYLTLRDKIQKGHFPKTKKIKNKNMRLETFPSFTGARDMEMNGMVESVGNNDSCGLSGMRA
jgi:hypothetical protein